MDCLDKVRVTNSGYLRVCHDCNGCLDTLAELPTENVEKDMIYFVRETELYYSWDGTNWNPTGGEFELAGTGGGGGSTPTIGENGNWHIDGEDTGKPSRGEKGDPGEKGEPGPKGDPGATDASGVTFDNSNTWLEETNVQDAIENLDENIGQWFIDGYFNEWSYMASPSDTTGLPYVYSHSEVQNSISVWKDIIARSLNAFGTALNRAFSEISNLKKTTTYQITTLLNGATGTITIYKVGRVCMLVWSGLSFNQLAQWSYVDIASLPEEFRPITHIRHAGLTGGGYAFVQGYFDIYPNGQVRVGTGTQTTTGINGGSITYITAS